MPVRGKLELTQNQEVHNSICFKWNWHVGSIQLPASRAKSCMALPALCLCDKQFWILPQAPQFSSQWVAVTPFSDHLFLVAMVRTEIVETL